MRNWRNLSLFFRATIGLYLLGSGVIFTGYAHAAEPMQIRYWNATDARDKYEVALLLLALDKTAADYPAYNLSRLDDDLGSDRARHELARGELINLYASPYRAAEGNVESKIIQIPIPLLKGLLGYRNLVIRKKDASEFERVATLADLQQKVVGQGRGWPDVAIYRHNGLKVMDEGLFSNLFAMLSLERFDCLPLGVVEAQAMLDEYGGDEKGLVVAKDLTVYYPWPVLFQVSAKQPLLAERITKGLLLAMQDGSMDALFEFHYGELVAGLKQNESRMIVLENPILKQQMGLQEPQLTALGL